MVLRYRGCTRQETEIDLAFANFVRRQSFEVSKRLEYSTPKDSYKEQGAASIRRLYITQFDLTVPKENWVNSLYSSDYPYRYRLCCILSSSI
jgi:hypothetical protein